MKTRLWGILSAGLAALLVGCVAGETTAVVLTATSVPEEPTMTATVPSLNDIQRISPEEAKALLDAGEAVLYDARSTLSYVRGHAAGALSFPETELASRFDDLPVEGGKALIFYCT